MALISTITTTQAQLASSNHWGVLSGPISSGRLQNSTRGMAAKGNCRLSTTWLSTSSGLVAPSPSHSTVARAGTRARLRVSRRRCQSGKRMCRKPSMTIWPAMVAVSVELWPEASNATANNVLAREVPRLGESRS